MIWWVKRVVICLMSGFFMLFGIQVLISAYSQKDLGVFVILFFASNFMILISAAIFFGYIYRMIRYGSGKDAKDPEEAESAETVENVEEEN